MSYISNAKIDYNFISPSFQYTQLQHFCPQIPQQRAGYSTSRTYIYRAGEYKEFNLICGVRAVTKCLYLFSFIILYLFQMHPKNFFGLLVCHEICFLGY